ncbi:MAG: three-Cys-motif partner protein TcmP [Planctomycetes bacterium]|nr:three-Cys-motif partner protein TcmP [Planctomycetota bacterium]
MRRNRTGCRVDEASTTWDKLMQWSVAMAERRSLEDDGLRLESVAAHSERKYRLIGVLASMFATGMKKKWKCRVYVDLFAGPGRARLEESGRIVAGSPILALDIRDAFDRYVFCEEDPAKLAALAQRVRNLGMQDRCHFIGGDCNDRVQDVLNEIPAASSNHTVLSLCIVDPYKLEDLRFDTIAALSVRYVDFLCLIPSFMDANRNWEVYVQEGNSTVARFLGDETWRDRWNRPARAPIAFGDFLLTEFINAMEKLKYMHGSLNELEPVKIAFKNVSLYHLPYFSRHQKGIDFWRKAKKYSSDQLELS